MGFDDRLDAALLFSSLGEGKHDPVLDWWDSWFVYFINPGDPKARELADKDFGHGWSGDERPQVMLYLLGDGFDLQILYSYVNGRVVKDVSDLYGKYEHLDVDEYDEMVQDIERAVLSASPKAKDSVMRGIALLKQEPVTKYELPDEDTWDDGGNSGGVKFDVNYQVLGFGEL